MTVEAWYLILGLTLLLMTFSAGPLKRLPISSALIYLILGWVLGKFRAGSFSVERDSELLERFAEIAVIVSLFTTGLKLRPHGTGRSWAIPARLASASMLLTILAVTVIGVFLLGLPVGAAVLLGAVLAPTDPVLASDVQVVRAGDEDPVRHGLTGEAGLNDGTAFPFVMLGLGLLGLHGLGEAGWRWLAVDLLWAVMGGLGIGWVLGTLVGRAVLFLRTHHREAVGVDEFLTLGLIAGAYGLAVVLHAYGFLAVLAAGLSLRRIETAASSAAGQAPEDVKALAKTEEAETHPAHAPAYLADASLAFNERLEGILELGAMLMTGILLAQIPLPWSWAWVVPLLLLVVRPIAVMGGLLGSTASAQERGLIAWFGIRGIGSLYYLFYAINHGLPEKLNQPFTGLVLLVIAGSVIVHGISVTPVMRRYRSAPRGT
jgi:NhaP-type Na+/H+ or K+/H+ antiporter